jgi:putative methionine-R-sulfoxide reductase with GAF domain
LWFYCFLQFDNKSIFYLFTKTTTSSTKTNNYIKAGSTLTALFASVTTATQRMATLRAAMSEQQQFLMNWVAFIDNGTALAVNNKNYHYY